jgi:hypothetical protein
MIPRAHHPIHLTSNKTPLLVGEFLIEEPYHFSNELNNKVLHFIRF